MVNKKIINEWLNFADEDYQFASVNLKEHDKFFSRICFFFQQAAEKYLKAFIVAHKLPFRKIHDLAVLVEICGKKDKSFSQFKDNARFLTDLYIDTRYPVTWPIEQNKKEAEKAQIAAKKIGGFVKGKLHKIPKV